MKRTQPEAKTEVESDADHKQRKKRLISDYFVNKEVLTSSSPKPIQNYIIEWLQYPTTLIHGRFTPNKHDPTNQEGYVPPKHSEPYKLACFDLVSITFNSQLSDCAQDQTLITTKGKHTFPKSEFDWKWTNQSVANRIRQLVLKRGYIFVVISNQLGMSQAKQLPAFKRKIAKILETVTISLDYCLTCKVQIDVHAHFLMSIQRDNFRKPNIGMFEYLRDTILYAKDHEIDFESSFFVGDAAGRSADKERVRDHSDSDLEFARSAGLQFYVPEEVFEVNDQDFGSKFLNEDEEVSKQTSESVKKEPTQDE